MVISTLEKMVGNYGIVIERILEDEIEHVDPSTRIYSETVAGFSMYSCPVAAPQAMTIKNGIVIVLSADGKIYQQTVQRFLELGQYSGELNESVIPSDLIPADFDSSYDLILYKEPHYFDGKFHVVGAYFKNTWTGFTLYSIEGYDDHKVFILESEDGLNWSYNEVLTALGPTDFIKFDGKYYVSIPNFDLNSDPYAELASGIYTFSELKDTVEELASSMEEHNLSTYDLWSYGYTFGFIELGGKGLVHTATTLSSSTGIPASDILGLNSKIGDALTFVTKADIETLF